MDGYVYSADGITSSPWGKVDTVFADGVHRYWSTHCRHDRHDACSAVEVAPGVPRRPAVCKTCSSPCRCSCHRQPASGRAEILAKLHEDFTRIASSCRESLVGTPPECANERTAHMIRAMAFERAAEIVSEMAKETG